jgi:SAM-dependent methyltransferase
MKASTVSAFYKIAYRFHFTPWERAARTHGYMINALLDREEAEREPPYGYALDLGCGTGLWTVELARRGWDVLGIENVPRAVTAARARAERAGVQARFIQGDVTALRTAGVGFGFRLLLDLGCFHGLTNEQRAAMGREVTAVADIDAALLILVWAPGRRGPLPRGASREDLESAFPEWKVVADDALDVAALPGLLKNVDPRCYRLRRKR